MSALNSVDIILPCFNPNRKWYFELLSFDASVKNLYRINYILVNDGSSSHKIEEDVEMLQAKGISLDYIYYPDNKGKGYALRQGVAASKAEFIVYTDVDFPFTNESTLELMNELTRNNVDVVSGFRNENYYLKKMTLYRKILSKAFRGFLRNFLNMQVTDTQCGLKGFNQKGKEKFLATRINRYLFDFEFIYTVCKNKNLRIKTVPVKLKDNVVFSKMKLKILFQETLNLLYILLFRRS